MTLSPEEPQIVVDETSPPLSGTTESSAWWPQLTTDRAHPGSAAGGAIFIYFARELGKNFQSGGTTAIPIQPLGVTATPERRRRSPVDRAAPVASAVGRPLLHGQSAPTVMIR